MSGDYLDGIPEPTETEKRAARSRHEDVELWALAKKERSRQARLEDVISAVRALRGAGCSWTKIGFYLGITRQAAQQYYGPRL